METNNSTIGLSALVERLLSTSPTSDKLLISATEVVEICQRATAHFTAQPSLLKIGEESTQEPNLVIFGDLHGNLKSLQAILQANGKPPTVRYLGLGDYVSRGAHSVEVFLILAGLSVLHPQHVHLLRGGHESKAIASVYGFTDELTKKGINTPEVKQGFWNLFNSLPYAAVVNQQYFCVHGGISPQILETDQPLEVVRLLERGTDVPDAGPITDLLYADPLAEPATGFQQNPRGVGHCFGRDVLTQFLERTKLKGIIRSREYINTGHNQVWDGSIFNVFSSADYMQGGEPTGYYLVDHLGTVQGRLA